MKNKNLSKLSVEELRKNERNMTAITLIFAFIFHAQ